MPNVIKSYPRIHQPHHREALKAVGHPVVIQEKYDGSQISFGIIDGKLEIKSHHKRIDLDQPGMFAKAVDTIKALHKNHYLVRDYVYRGEYLSKPKHNTLTYGRVPDGYIVLYDIEFGNGSNKFSGSRYVAAEAQRLGLEPAVTHAIDDCWVEGVFDQNSIRQNFWDRESSLGGKAEGFVVKCYSVLDCQDKVLMVKYVNPEFSEKHQGDWKKRHPNKKDILAYIVGEFNKEAIYKKAVQNLNEQGLLKKEVCDIGPLVKEIYTDFANEQSEVCKQLLWDHFGETITKMLVGNFAKWYKDELAQDAFTDALIGTKRCNTCSVCLSDACLQEPYPYPSGDCNAHEPRKESEVEHSKFPPKDYSGLAEGTKDKSCETCTAAPCSAHLRGVTGGCDRHTDVNESLKENK